MERKRYAERAAWAAVVVLGLLVLARVASGLPVAAQAGVMVGDPTATPTSPAPTATVPAPVQDGVVNHSFETGDLTGWLTAVSDSEFDAPRVYGSMARSMAKLPDWPAMDGDYSAWTFWYGSGPGWIRLMQDLTVPNGRPVLVFDYRAAWDLVPQIAGADELTGFEITVPDHPFYVVIEEAGGGKELARHLILTAPGGEFRLNSTISSYTPYVEDTGILNAVVDMRQFAGQAVRVVLEWQVPSCDHVFALMQVDNFRWKQGWSQPRTDVSVIVYGGWDGMVARAWVGGTAQPELITAVNAFGDAQAMWTFYPDGTWPVVVSVDLPAGLDPDVWELQLIRVTSPTMGWANEEPVAAAASIVGGHQYQFVYQLVHK